MGICRAATQLSGRSIFSNREQDYAKRETNRSPQIRSKGRNRNVIRPFFRRTRGRRDGDVAYGRPEGMACLSPVRWTVLMP